MQAMNLHPAQQDILLNLLNVQPGKAQGMSKMPQDEMSFSSMLERADKTYSTEGKNIQKTQDASPKTEALSKNENALREESSVNTERTDNHAETEKADSRDEVRSGKSEEAFDVEKAGAEIEKLTLKTETAVSEEMVNGGESAEKACLTLPDAGEITEAGTEQNVLEENVLSEGLSFTSDKDAAILENAQMADKSALSARLETKPVTDAAAAVETEAAASEKTEENELSSDRKTKKKEMLSDGSEAAELMKAESAVTNEVRQFSETDAAAIAAVSAKNEHAAEHDGRIEIIDERTHAESGDNVLTTTTVIDADNSSAEMVMTLPVQAAGSETNGSLEAGYSKADFSQMLNNSLAASKDDLVKAGSIILQDNKKGSINLILRPEELGNVKVKLELSDNQITGKIVVASKEAYDAFRQNLEDIRNAFVANGFDACGFDLAWAGTGDSNGSQSQDSADNGSANQFGRQYYGVAYEDNFPDSVHEYYAENTHINLVA